ncbi:MAG: hypothetical protein KDC53_08170 [Saprospiraceae bacterium]|nr:hypothetical protein [Saprospiraceae bacterium]
MKLRNLILVPILMMACFTLTFAQKADKSKVIGLRVTADLANTLKKVKVDAFNLKNGIIYASDNYQVIYDAKTGKFIFVRIDDQSNDLRPADGTLDMGGGVTLRCSSNCKKGCDPVATKKGPTGTVYECTDCATGCTSSVYVPDKKVISKVTMDGEENFRG